MIVLLILVLVLLVPGSRVLRDAVVTAPVSLPAIEAVAPTAPHQQDMAAAPVQPTAVVTPNRGIAPPQVSAQAVYAFDLESGTVLYEKNIDERRPVASITKAVTALVTVNNASLDEQVKIIDSDLLDPNSAYTRMGLVSGDTLTVAQLLYGLLLPSGGDAAKALARHVGEKLSGSTDPDTARTAFIDEMNNYVQKLGLKNSFFTDPDGEDDANAFSSAHDVAIIGGELMKNADLAFIVNQPTYSIPSQVGEPYTGINTNELLGKDGVIGIKTGSTEGAGASLLIARSMNNGNNVVIVAVLGSTIQYDASSNITADERYTDSQTIFADMDARFTWTSLDQTGDTFAGLKDEMAVWGVGLKDPPVMPIDMRAEDKPSYQLVLDPPTDGGKQAGTVLLFTGDTPVASVPVYQLGSNSGRLHPQQQAA
ncbi:MAG: D-alanyl-D-alanine carboxypeptidase family protein [Thermomicrobiales bacterium]